MEEHEQEKQRAANRKRRMKRRKIVTKSGQELTVLYIDTTPEERAAAAKQMDEIRKRFAERSTDDEKDVVTLLREDRDHGHTVDRLYKEKLEAERNKNQAENENGS